MDDAKSSSGRKSPMLLNCSKKKRIRNDESKRKELLFDMRYLYSYTYFRRLVVVAVQLEKTRDILTQSTTTTTTTTTATSKGETSQEYALSFPTTMCTNNPNKLKGGREKHALQNIKHKTKTPATAMLQDSSSNVVVFLAPNRMLHMIPHLSRFRGPQIEIRPAPLALRHYSGPSCKIE